MSQASQQEQENFVLLLDQQWQIQQQKTFTAWVNSHLRKQDMSITSLEDDFKDGVKLMKLLETISGDELGRPDKGKSRIPCIQNINKALDFIKSKGVRLAGIGAEEINDGNLKMVLGMIWTIILRFQIQDISVEEMTAKEGLLLWCQRKTAGYQNVDVKNFHVSFQDGLAFCALIHRHRPDLLDFNSLSKENMKENLNLAFQIADKELDIAPLLDADDMVNTAKPDERSVMTYIAAYYHYFSQFAKNENAARRVAKVIALSRENARMKQEYESLASDLLDWIVSAEQKLNVRENFDVLSDVQKKQTEFRHYKKSEKPEKFAEKAKLEGLHSSLQTKLMMNNRPPYVPGAGKLLSDIDNAWANLETCEGKRQEFIRNELIRLEKIEFTAARFSTKVRLHHEWMSDKEQMLESTDYGHSIGTNLAKKKQHAAFESALSAQEGRLTLIDSIANELASQNYHDIDSIRSEAMAVKNKWGSLKQLSNARKQKLEEEEKRQHQIDEKRLDFAKSASKFSYWIDAAKEDLQENIRPGSLSELQELVAAHEEFKNSLNGKQVDYEALLNEYNELQKLGNEENPYTSETNSTISEKWESLKVMVSSRDEQMGSENQTQERKENIRIAFADAANAFGKWLESTKGRISGAQSGDISSQLEKLKAIQPEISSHANDLDTVIEKSNEMEDAMVFQNRHTAYTAEVLSAQYSQLKEQIAKLVKELEYAVLSKDAGGISEEILGEYRSSFNHFDQNKNGFLERLEFRACLMSLGYDLPDLKPGQKDPEFDKVMKIVDPDNTEKVQFEPFVDFMTKEMADSDNPEQIKDSFRIIAGNKSCITEEDLRRDLEPEDAKYCIENMAPAGNGLDYSTFTEQLYE